MCAQQYCLKFLIGCRGTKFQPPCTTRLCRHWWLPQVNIVGPVPLTTCRCSPTFKTATVQLCRQMLLLRTGPARAMLCLRRIYVTTRDKKKAAGVKTAAGKRQGWLVSETTPRTRNDNTKLRPAELCKVAHPKQS